MPYQSSTPTQTQNAPTNYFTQAQQLMASSNPSTQGAGVVAGAQAPGIAQSGLSMAQILQELGLAVPNANETAASATLNAEYGLGQAGIGEEQLGIQQQGLAAQLGLSQAQQGYEQQQYALQQQQYPEQLQEAATANKQAVMGLQSGQAIGGTATTPGAKLANQAQAQNYGFQVADINRAQQTAALGQASEQAGYQYSAGDIARSQQNLELTAQANGLSVQQLLAQWQQGLQQTGIQADPLAAYTQYLSQEGTGVQGLGTAAGQEGLLTPGQLSTGAMNGGFNPMSLFQGTGQ